MSYNVWHKSTCAYILELNDNALIMLTMQLLFVGIV